MVLDVSHNTYCAIRKKKRTDFSGILFVMVLFLICPTDIEASEADYRIHSNNGLNYFTVYLYFDNGHYIFLKNISSGAHYVLLFRGIDWKDLK